MHAARFSKVRQAQAVALPSSLDALHTLLVPFAVLSVKGSLQSGAMPVTDDPLQVAKPKPERTTEHLHLRHAALVGPLVDGRSLDPEHRRRRLHVEQPVWYPAPHAAAPVRC